MATAQPDILWILCTQWRAQSLGFAGDPNARTPCLDQFAREATHYRQAVTPHPFGPFARAALMTGVPSPDNGVRDYYDPLPRASRTIAQDLGEAGYESAFFGKWHLAPRDPKAALVGDVHARQLVAKEDRGGFGFWEGFESGFLLNDPWLQGSRLPEPTRFPGYQSEVLVSRYLEWLAERGQADGGQAGENKACASQAETLPEPRDFCAGEAQNAEPSRGPKRAPLFSVLSLEPPHPPYAAPANGIQSYATGSLQLRGNLGTTAACEEQARRELSGYYAHIEATDRALGRLLSSPLLRDTVVVFTSVHGDMHGSHGLFRKGWPQEESIRVPLLVREPGLQRAKTEEAAVSLLDLHAWTRAWAGLGTTEQRQPPATVAISMPSVVRLPQQCDRVWRGLRSPTRKLILNEDGSPWLYYRLDEDPLELRNLAAEPEAQEEIGLLKQLLTPRSA